jgi:hypothetical protein
MALCATAADRDLLQAAFPIMLILVAVRHSAVRGGYVPCTSQCTDVLAEIILESVNLEGWSVY